MSMLTLNLNNIEKIIFQNASLRKRLPEFTDFFNQWSLSQRIPQLRNMGKQAIVDLLASLNDAHLEIISEYLQTPVSVDKVSNRVIKNFETTTDQLEEFMKGKEVGNYFLYRKGEQVYISSWR